MKYPDLRVYLSEGEPRFELLNKGDVVDTVRVGRYDIKTLRKLMNELGLKRDESYTWERKSAEYKMERAFKEANYMKGDEQPIKDEF